MIATLHAEWIKLRSLRFTWAAAVAAAVLMAAMALVVAASVVASSANGYDVAMSATEVAANGTLLAQLPLLAVAGLVITGEYGTGGISTTLRGTPLRGRLLLAKALMVAGVGFVAGLLLAGIGIAAAGLVLGDAGTFSAAEGWSTPLRMGGYLALVGALTVGVGAALRSTVVTLLVMLLLLVAAPTLLELSSADWILTARDYLPSTAGEAFVTGNSDTYPTGIGALVLGVWAACALLVGYAVLWLRDA